MAHFQLVFWAGGIKRCHMDWDPANREAEEQECFFLPKIHWWRLPCNMGHCCGAASKCVQCLVAHVPPFFWVFQRLPDKNFDWQFVLVAHIPCGRSPDCQKNKWASIWLWICSFSLSWDGESLQCATPAFCFGVILQNPWCITCDNATEEFWLPLKAVQKIKTHPSNWPSAQSSGSLEPSWCTLFSCPNPVLKFDGR